MADISKIRVDGVAYDIKDATARSMINTMSVSALNSPASYQYLASSGFLNIQSFDTISEDLLASSVTDSSIDISVDDNLPIGVVGVQNLGSSSIVCNNYYVDGSILYYTLLNTNPTDTEPACVRFYVLYEKD